MRWYFFIEQDKIQNKVYEKHKQMVFNKQMKIWKWFWIYTLKQKEDSQ
jgi:hypothetical protein